MKNKVKLISGVFQSKLEIGINDFIKDKSVKSISIGGSDRMNVLIWYEGDDNE